MKTSVCDESFYSIADYAFAMPNNIWHMLSGELRRRPVFVLLRRLSRK
jgi:hypothetical protein